jgi:SAM-dependent methyltransferase
MIDSGYWARYYEVTVERPAWETVRLAIEGFASEALADSRERLAVDLGCGAGRDTRELLRAGWRVLAVDRESAAIGALDTALEPDLKPRLQTLVADLATVEIPKCDLVNASVSLPFLGPDDLWATWRRALGALRIGGRIATMLYGDRDASAGDPSMTCVSPEAVRASLEPFEIEHWLDVEEDSVTALGEAHHFHRLDVVARRIR